MRPLEVRTAQFWNAAHFYRHAKGRDMEIAVKVLEQVSQTTTGTVQQRAIQLLKEIRNERSHDH